jgi:hypothetical protein
MWGYTEFTRAHGQAYPRPLIRELHISRRWGWGRISYGDDKTEVPLAGSANTIKGNASGGPLDCGVCLDRLRVTVVYVALHGNMDVPMREDSTLSLDPTR